MKMNEFLETCGRGIARHARTILLVTAAVVLVSIFLSFKLGIDTDMGKMLPKDNITAQTYTRITKDFDSTSTLIAVIEGPSRESLVKAALQFAERIKSDTRTTGLIRSTQLTVDRTLMEKWGFLLQDAEDLADTKDILSTTRMLPLLQKTNDLIESKLADGDNEEVEGAEGEDSSYALMEQFGLFASRLKTIFASGGEGDTDTLADAWIFGEEYMIDPEGKTLLLSVKPNFNIGDRKKLVALSDGAEAIGNGITAETSGISFRFTGDVESEANEDRAIGADVFLPSVIAFTLIIALFFFSFNRRRSILFPLAALGAGILVDLAIAAITVKNLNMITSSFGALLVGLGIDFGIHIVTRYDEATYKGKLPAEALAEVFSTVAGPIFIGGITTAVAFFALTFSNTVAFRQFGFVAGTGIITTLLASFTVLPALLALFPGKPGETGAKKLIQFTFARKITLFSVKHRWVVLASVFILTVAAVVMIPRNGFEYDMRKIGPQKTNAMAAETIVADRFGISTWQHLTIADSIEETRNLQEAFKKAPLVLRVQSIADYIPTEEEQNASLAVIAAIRDQGDRTAGENWTAETVTLFLEEIQRLEWNMIELGDLAATSIGEDALPVRKRNAMIREIFGNETGKKGDEVFLSLIETVKALPAGEAALRLGRIDDGFSAALDKKVAQLASVNRRIAIADLPEETRADLVNEDESKFLVIIHPGAKLSGENNFRRFTEGLKAVDPRTTGTLTLGFELSREILSESEKMAFVIALIIFTVVFIGFKKIKPTLACCLGFLCAFAWLFGLSPLIGKFNIVNALSIPLIIGVGIDYSVHMITALRSHDGQSSALQQTGKAVTLSMLTTLIGFGSLALIGQYKGIADLGKTLSVGILCCYIGSIVITPALWGLVKINSKEGKKS